MRVAYDRAAKMPADLVGELARAVSLSQAAWAAARSANDFGSFAPHLERMVELKRRQAACLSAGRPGPAAPAYDALLDLFEPGSGTASIAAVFARLRVELAELLGRIRSRPQVDDSVLRRACPAARQAEICEWLMGLLSYDRSSGRLDTTAHPFTTTLGADDVRITTRYLEGFFVSSVFSTIHETGHALYELGLDPGADFARTRLHEAASMAVHESQSRLWENMVGRSRAFWKGNYSRLAELAGPCLEGVDLDRFVKAVNRVEPSPIRTEADEVTYGLHVILRFELESELVAGRLSVKDLPSAWNGKMKELLGVVPPDDARGCLQDVHWSAGLFGYFPSYALGNLYAAQFWAAMKRELPDLDARIEAGDLGSLLLWLRANIHEPARPISPASSSCASPAPSWTHRTSRPTSARSTRGSMDSSAATLARGGILADPCLWIAAAALLAGLGAGQLLRAFRGGGRHGRPERLRAGRISRSIASLSLGILALTGLFVLADKGALSRVIADGALPWTAALFCAALAAGYRPLSVGLPLALVAAAAIATVRLGLEGWLPIRHAAADGSMEIARLLPYEVGASSFRGQLELPERDSVPVFQDIRLASSSVGLLAEVVELKGPATPGLRASRAAPRRGRAPFAFDPTLPRRGPRRSIWGERRRCLGSERRGGVVDPGLRRPEIHRDPRYAPAPPARGRPRSECFAQRALGIGPETATLQPRSRPAGLAAGVLSPERRRFLRLDALSPRYRYIDRPCLDLYITDNTR